MSLARALPRLSNQDLANIRLESEERLLRHRGSGPNCQSCALHRQLASMAQELEEHRKMTDVWATATARPEVGQVLTADALAACRWPIEYEVLESHWLNLDGNRVQVIESVKVLTVRDLD